MIKSFLQKKFLIYTLLFIIIFLPDCQNNSAIKNPTETPENTEKPITVATEVIISKTPDIPVTNTFEIKFTGKVTRVVDGDTIYISTDEGQVKIRLLGIDCPEKDQPYGDKATQFAYDMVMGETITAVAEEGNVYDRYGRFLGNVLLEDGRSLNEELVRNGLAWHYKQYSNDPVLADLEEKSREKKNGLWADEDPIPPWEWRRMH